MKKFITIFTILMAGVFGLWGCNASVDCGTAPLGAALNKAQIIHLPDGLDEALVSSIMANESPSYVDTLPNDNIVRVYGVDTIVDPIAIGFSYTDEDNQSTDLILQMGVMLDHFVLFDGAGAPLCGYQTAINAESGVDFTFFSGDNAIAATLPRSLSENLCS